MPRRVVWAFAVIALVGTACGSDHKTATKKPKPTTTSSTSSSTSVEETTTVPAAEETTTVPGSAGFSSTTTAAPRTGGGGGATTTAPSPPAGPDLGAAHVKLTPVATMDRPLAMAVRKGDANIYVAEKTGRIRMLGGAVVLDLSTQVTPSASQPSSEQGLLGLAFSPDGRFLYVNYTDLAGNTHVTEYAFDNGRANTATRRDVLIVNQPYPNHNGGNLVFGPDGKLWIGLGDGGSAGDPQNRAQNLGTLLGKMLRIDPRPSGGQPYGIPADNPLVGRAGARGEIWAFGLRNPWRYSFDAATQDLWIGDVGQNAWEEIDFRPAGDKGGENYGWPALEGTHPYRGSAPAGAVGPIHEYSHNGTTCSVTGGYVYRGTKIPALRGAYLFADYCAGDVMGLRQAGGRAAEVRSLGIRADYIASFGVDAAGELYVMSQSGGVFRVDPAS